MAYSAEKKSFVRVILSLVYFLLLLLTAGVAIGQIDSHSPFIFGILTDVHYADQAESATRYYRAALGKLEVAVADLNRSQPAFTIQLGDIVDGNYAGAEKTKEDLDRVLSVYNKLAMPVHHVVGNHCLSVGRETLREKLGRDRLYYDFAFPEAPEWRFVVIDGYDLVCGSRGYQQKTWFLSTLESARRAGEKVICFCHFPLLKGGRKKQGSAPYLEVLEESGCVVAWFAGHDHVGGYGFHGGVHHLTFNAIVEGPRKNAYALVELYPDRIKIVGFGEEPSRELILRCCQ